MMHAGAAAAQGRPRAKVTVIPAELDIVTGARPVRTRRLGDRNRRVDAGRVLTGPGYQPSNRQILITASNPALPPAEGLTPTTRKLASLGIVGLTLRIPTQR